MIYDLAGIAGVDPGPLTLGELLPMATAKARHDWDLMSHLLALTHNVNCTRRAECVKPLQLNPFRQPPRRRQDAAEVVDILVAAFSSNGRAAP